MNDSKAGRVVFEYKGNKYVVCEQVKMKNPETREWLPSVMYRRLDIENGDKYVREDTEFQLRFKLIGCLDGNGNLRRLPE